MLDLGECWKRMQSQFLFELWPSGEFPIPSATLSQKELDFNYMELCSHIWSKMVATSFSMHWNRNTCEGLISTNFICTTSENRETEKVWQNSQIRNKRGTCATQKLNKTYQRICKDSDSLHPFSTVSFNPPFTVSFTPSFPASLSPSLAVRVQSKGGVMKERLSFLCFLRFLQLRENVDLLQHR